MRRFTFVTFVILAAGLVACGNRQNQAAQNSTAPAGDPSDGNLAPVNQPAAQPQQTPPVPASGESYAAPPPSENYNATGYEENSSYEPAVQASEPPPPLPEYSQPPVPGDDYVWTPGYWAYADGGYYWVPGAWVLAPYVDALWTPPWWGYDNGVYLFHSGYWAPYIGYYGGIDYGFGYTGHGYYGGYWDHDRMDYNRAVTNVNTAVVHHYYDRRAPLARQSHVSYNGGRGGIDARPTPQELAVTSRERTAPVRAQVEHQRAAVADHAQFAKAGKPAALATPHPLATTYKAPAARPPAAVTRSEQRTAQQARPQPAPARAEQQRGPLQATRVPENRPVPQTRPVPQVRPEPQPQAHAQARPAERPNVQRAPQARAEARPAEHPAVQRPQAHAEARPAEHPAVQRPQAHAEARPAPRVAARPAPQTRPQPHRGEVAQARPAAPPQPVHPAPHVRAQVRPEQRPAPQARLEARPATPPRVVAQPHPAPRPEPAKPEPAKKEHTREH